MSLVEIATNEDSTSSVANMLKSTADDLFENTRSSSYFMSSTLNYNKKNFNFINNSNYSSLKLKHSLNANERKSKRSINYNLPYIHDLSKHIYNSEKLVKYNFNSSYLKPNSTLNNAAEDDRYLKKISFFFFFVANLDY